MSDQTGAHVCFFLPPRWEAIQVLVGGLRVAIRPERRADEALPQTHRRQAF